MERFCLLEFRAQLDQPTPVGSLGLRVEHLESAVRNGFHVSTFGPLGGIGLARYSVTLPVTT